MLGLRLLRVMQVSLAFCWKTVFGWKSVHFRSTTFQPKKRKLLKQSKLSPLAPKTKTTFSLSSVQLSPRHVWVTSHIRKDILSNLMHCCGRHFSDNGHIWAIDWRMCVFTTTSFDVHLTGTFILAVTSDLARFPQKRTFVDNWSSFFKQRPSCHPTNSVRETKGNTELPFVCFVHAFRTEVCSKCYM